MQTLKNIMLVKDEDRNLNALFDGEPERDLMGRKIGEPFNAAEYMNRKPVDYEGIMDRAGKMIKRCDQSSQFATTWYVKDNRMRQAAAELYMEVLLAHPEDAAKPEYRKMQEQMNRVYDEITERAYEETRDIAKARKEAAAEMLEENRLNYRKTHEPVEYLRELETEAVQTGNFRKFALALSETELAIPSMTREAKLAYGEYQWTLVTAEKGADFYNNLFYEVSLLNMEESARFSHDAEELARSIRQTVTDFPEVQGAYDLVLNNYGPNSWNGSIHIEVPDTCSADQLDQLIRSIQMAVYRKHQVILTAIGVYSVNTKDEEVIEARKKVQEIVFSHPHVKQMHGFYLVKDQKSMRFDIVISFDAEDRRAVYTEVVADVQKAFPDYTLQVAMDTDFAEE